MIKLIKIITLFAIVFLSSCYVCNHAHAQSLNVTGNCVVDGNPNGVGNNLDVVNQLIECSIVADTTNHIYYAYDDSQASGARWRAFAFADAISMNTNTRLDNPRVVSTNLVFDIIDVVDSDNVIGTETIALSSLQDGVVTSFTSSGAGSNRTIVLGRSIGGNITGTLNVNDLDSSPSNEVNTAFDTDATNLFITDASGTINVPLVDIAPVQSVAGTNDITVTEPTTGNYVIDFTETNTTLTYNAATFILTYTGEDGTPVDRDLSDLRQVITTVDGTNSSVTTLSNTGGTLTIAGSESIDVEGSAGTSTITLKARPVYTSNAEAFAALGAGKPFTYGFGSTEKSAGTDATTITP